MPLQILVVEDDFLVGTHLAALLMGAGCEVVGPVGGVDSALTIVQARPLDGATIDLRLHKARPVEPIVDALQARGIPYVFVTGHAGDGLADRFPDAAVIHKPCGAEDIHAWVAAVRTARPGGS